MLPFLVLLQHRRIQFDSWSWAQLSNRLLVQQRANTKTQTTIQVHKIKNHLLISKETFIKL